ncbi:MAG: T9SS type A sorting domain-containing protein [Bacteroidales bacterium]|nr:T9SS type A sorting domain-containing protein [Bacteroidales bacterium]
MKRTLITALICVLIYFNLSSQTSFQINFETPGQAKISNGIETPEGNFIFLVNNFASFPGSSHTYILNTDANGNILQTVVVDFYDYIILHQIIYNEDDGNYFIIGGITSYNDFIIDSFFVSRWTEDLELLSYSKFAGPFPGHTAILSMAIMDSNGQFVLVGYKKNPTCFGFIYVLDNELNLVNQKIFNFSSFIFSVSQFIYENSGGYLFTFAGKPPGFISSGEYIVKTDYSLNVIDYYKTHQIHGWGYTFITKYSDTVFIVTGKYSPPNPNISRDVGVEKVDHNNNLLAYNIFGKPGADTIDFPGLNPGAAIVDADNIYIPGTSNMDVIQFPYSPYLSWFMLNKTDGNLNLQWQKFYGGDAYYVLYSIIPTSDGGCVMMGTRYHPNNPTGVDAYILKVGPDGLMSVPDEPGGIQMREVILYPNPGTTQLNIQTGHDNLYIKLYDARGLLHYEGDVGQYFHIINTAAWPAGVYLYQITKGREVMEQGKWVKGE